MYHGARNAWRQQTTVFTESQVHYGHFRYIEPSQVIPPTHPLPQVFFVTIAVIAIGTKAAG
jgi:hypothetical protein